MRAPDGHDATPAADPAPADPTPDASPADPAPATDPAPADPAPDATILGGDAPATDPAEPEAPAEPAGAPEAYDLKAPEGMTLDTDALAIAEPVLRDLNLTNEQAQKLTDAYGQILPKLAERYQAQQTTQITEQRAAWAAEAKADPEIGGANWDASIAASAKALDRLGAPAGSPFRALLNDSGLGNHPEMIRMFAKIGKSIGEDADFVSSSARQPQSREEKYYGSRSA
ncbi:hypothetical protein [Sphingomonas sp.]|uniref:hypothetical protein n=1 Tax=Sphingomonas sp. TaxID=28214 RepID=UPI0035C7E1E3